MSTVDIITTALAAGAAAGTKDTATAAVKDAYAALKSLITRRMGTQPALPADETSPEAWQATLSDSFPEAAADPEIVEVARQLLALTTQTKTMNIDVTTNNGAVGEFHAPITFNQG